MPQPGSAPRPQPPQGGMSLGQPQGQMPPKPPGMGQAAGAGAAATNGFGDLLDRLRRAGLGDQVDSWVGKGQNRPIDPSQVTQALGPQQVHELAQHAGLSDQQVADGLAKALPAVVNEVTPQGKIPDPGTLSNNIQRLFG